MNCLLRKSVLALLVGGLMCGSAMAQAKIGTIDLKRVFDNYWKTKQADSALKDRAADMEKEHKNMIDDYKKAREDYQALLTTINDPAISADEREKRKKTGEDKLKYLKDQEESIATYERQARSTLDEKRNQMRENILGEIRNIVNAKAKTAGYTLVVDTAAQSFNNTPVVMYVNNTENDMTDAVLQQLNLTAPPETATKPDEKKDTKKGSELLTPPEKKK